MVGVVCPAGAPHPESRSAPVMCARARRERGDDGSDSSSRAALEGGSLSSSGGRQLLQDAPPGGGGECLPIDCYSSTSPSSCPFTAFSAAEWSNVVRTNQSVLAAEYLTRRWSELTGTANKLVLGSGSNQLVLPDPVSLRCFLRLQGGDVAALGRLPLKRSLTFTSTIAGNVCSNKNTATFNCGSWAAEAVALTLNAALNDLLALVRVVKGSRV